MNDMTADLLVLGGSGRVGSLLRATLQGGEALRTGLCPETRAPRILWQQRRGPAGPEVLKWQPGAPLPEGLRVRAVLALWGGTSGPALTQNAVLARAALHLAQRIGADRVLHASSGAVQAGLTGAPAREEAPLAPLTPYGHAKAEMEAAVRDWHSRHSEGDGPRSVLLRLGNVAGADQLAAALARPGPVLLDRFTTGAGPRRAYIGVQDLARILGRLLHLPAAALPPVLNLAGPAPVSMEALVRAAGGAVLWRPAPAGALPLLALDTTRLAALTGPLPDSARADRLVAQWRQAQGAVPA